MFDVGSSRVRKFEGGSLSIKEGSISLALGALYAPAQARLGQADPLSRSAVVHFLGQGNDCFQVPHFDSVLHGPYPFALKQGSTAPASRKWRRSTAGIKLSTVFEGSVNLGSFVV